MKKVRVTTHISLTEARTQLGELTDRVKYGNEIIVITKHNKDVAKIIPIEE
jgi:prevent-host-death family protein